MSAMLWLSTVLTIAISFPPGASAQTQNAGVQAQTGQNVFQQQQIVNDLSKQMEAQQKVLADLNAKMSEHNLAEETGHVNDLKRSLQAQANVVANIQQQINATQVSSNDTYLGNSDQIQQSRVDRDQAIRSVQMQLEQQRQVVASLQYQLQAQIATNVESSLLDELQAETQEQAEKLNSIEDLYQSLQVQAGQALATEDLLNTNSRLRPSKTCIVFKRNIKLRHSATISSKPSIRRR